MMWPTIFLSAALVCGAEPAPPAEAAAPTHPLPSCLTLHDLVRMDRCELEALYRQSPPASPGCGYHRGRAIRCPGSRLTPLLSCLNGLLWKGKLLDDCCVVNRWAFGIKAVRARVYLGESWLDGGPALIMDYQGTSRVWDRVRDELREVAPGLYLGVMYRRRCPCPKQVMFFALEAPCCPDSDH